MSDINAANSGAGDDDVERVNALLAGIDPEMIDGGEHVAQYLGMSDEPASQVPKASIDRDAFVRQFEKDGAIDFEAAAGELRAQILKDFGDGKQTWLNLGGEVVEVEGLDGSDHDKMKSKDNREWSIKEWLDPLARERANANGADASKQASPEVNTIETPDSGRTPEVQAGEKDADKESVDGNGDKNDKDGKRAPIFGKDGYEIPKAVKALYVAVDGKFVDRKTEQISFEDIGRKLSTKSEDRKVIEHMIAVAEAKNWGTLDLKGTEAFRRQAWIAAEVAGLETTGYKPNAQDRAAVEARRAEMRISAGEKTAEQSRENTIEANADKAKAAAAPDKAVPEKTQSVPKPEPQPKQETKAPAPAADPAQAQQMTPEQLAELRKELGEWREQKTKEEIAEVIARHSDPAKRRQNAMELLRSVGRDPSEFFDENDGKQSAVQAGADKDKDASKSIEPSVAPDDKSDPQTSLPAREVAARLVLENEMNNMGLPEADRQAALDNLNAAFADARSKGVELEIPEPMVVDRAVSVDQSKAVEVTQPQPTHTQEVER